jgi:hypothetical protein
MQNRNWPERNMRGGRSWNSNFDDDRRESRGGRRSDEGYQRAEERWRDDAARFDSADQRINQFDGDYAEWREEQLQKIDSDYEEWRSERRKKFVEEFEKWRTDRAKGSQQEPGKK